MNAREKSQVKETIAHLQTRGDLFTRQLLQERQRSAHLQTNLTKVKNDIAQIRESNKQKAIELLNMHTTTTHDAYQRVDGLNPTRLADINQKKLVKNLESRLNKALVRQNEIQNENNVIKEKIDKLRRKIHNDGINRANMEKMLKWIKEEMDGIMEKAAIASELRDKAIEQRNQLMSDNLEEEQSFAKEYQELGTYIEKQSSLLEASIASVANDVIAKTSKLDSDGIPAEMMGGVNDDTNNLDKKISEMDKQLEMNKQLLQQTEEKIRTYEENFEQLQDVSGLVSTDDIIRVFVKNEEESFSLFNFIHGVNQETDSTLEQYAQLEQEIEAYSKEQVDKETKKVNLVNEYKECLKDAQDERQKMTEVAREGKATIEKIAKKVQTLYNTLKCDEFEGNEGGTTENVLIALALKSLDSLTTSSGKEVSERNILRSMELIEKRSMEVIAEYARKLAQNRKNRRKPSVLMSPKMFRKFSTSISHQAVAATATTTTVESSESKHPTFSDDEDSDDDMWKPMSLHDLRKMTAEKLTHNVEIPRKSVRGTIDVRDKLRNASGSYS